MLDYPFTGEVGEGLADGCRAEAEFGGQAGGHERMPPTEPPGCGVPCQGGSGHGELVPLTHHRPPGRGAWPLARAFATDAIHSIHRL